VPGRGGAGLACRRQADLLPVGYFHVVFTVPAGIGTIFYHNKAVVYDLRFRAAETLLTIAAEPEHLGARIGATAVLHSWGSAMTHHPHIDMIVPPAGYRSKACTGCAANPASCCRCPYCPVCSDGSSWHSSPTPTPRASCARRAAMASGEIAVAFRHRASLHLACDC